MLQFQPALVPTITAYAASSPIVTYKWKGRGQAPVGFVKGMAVMFGRVYLNFIKYDRAASEMAKSDTGNAYRDALTYYRAEFHHLGLSNAQPGVHVLRHVFVLLFGLGMRESSGNLFQGAFGNSAADTAEAGLFQTSYNSHHSNHELDRLFHYYKGKTDFLDIFSEGVSGGPSKNHGSGAGQQFQHLTKTCPAFAVEYAAVVVRNDRSYSAAINQKTAELRRECDTMLAGVQSLIDFHVQSGGALVI